MNITSMMRGLMGDAKPGESRVLELKTGQQVRGVVQSVADNGKEAVVNINGVAVRTVLETPLQPGQATWLVVEGQREDGMIMMKPSEGPSPQPLPTIGEALKQAGLPDESWARSLVQELERNGVPLTQDVMERLGKAVEMKPLGVPLEQWMQAAAVAVKRQLPLTADGLTGLQQAMFGKPLDELLTTFLKAADTMQGANLAGTAGQAALKEAQALVRTLLMMMPNTGEAAAGSTQQAASNSAQPAGQAGVLSNGTIGAASTQAGAAANGTAGAMSAGQPPSTGAAAGGTTAAPAQYQSAASGAQQAQNANAQAANASVISAGAGQGTAQATANGQAATAPNAQQAVGTHAGGMIGRMLSLLGVSHEHDVQRTLLQPSSNALQQASAPAAASQAAQGLEAALRQDAAMPAAARLSPDGVNVTPSQQQAAPQAGAAVQESLKSTLLQLLQSDSLPPAVRETAQQVVQQITGQQLLLASDRSQPFAHVTLFVPFVTSDGQQTAAVHIQARQGRKGELDAGNCRLWFDLDLKSLGHTQVDVNVIEKLVALNIHHSDETVQEQLRPYRSEIEAALEGIGYQMSAYRVLPIPEKEEHFVDAERVMKDYTPENYKGVDLRI